MRTRRRASTSSRPSSPARSAATRSPSSSRASSRSTTRWAPARAATAWARSPSSTRKRVVALPAPVARRRRDPRLGPAQPVLLPDAASRSRSTSASTSTTPFEKLPERVQHVVLHGSGEEKIAFRYLDETGRSAVKEHAFEGILPNLERRYRETDSVVVREELAKYLNTQRLPRMRRHAPAARGALRARSAEQHGIYELSALPLQGSAAVLRAPGARRRRRRAIAEQIVREIANRAAVPEQRRPRLPVARPLGRNALGRRGAAHPPRVADRLGAHRRDVRARRAVDRPAPARQRPPARHAEAPARPRQHGDRGRARRGGDPRRRLRGRHGPGRGRARRRRSCAGHARGHPARTRLAHRPVPLRRAGRSRCRRGAGAPTRRSSCAIARRARQQPEGRRRWSCRWACSSA